MGVSKEGEIARRLFEIVKDSRKAHKEYCDKNDVSLCYPFLVGYLEGELENLIIKLDPAMIRPVRDHKAGKWSSD